MAEKQQIYNNLSQQSWFQDRSLQNLLHFLNADHHEDSTRLVGGCIRNTLLGFPITDIDLATQHKPDKVMEILQKQSIKTIPTGIDHGTLTAVIGEKSYEITSLRRDVETDGRHAVVAYTNLWQEDARRRDFTVNALYMDQEGNIHDYVDGLRDIKARTIRFIGQPKDRIHEDYLRILRFFRFHAWYAQGALNEEGLFACQAFSEKLKELSRERIRVEVLKLLTAPDCSMVVETMWKHDIWQAFLPQVEWTSEFHQYTQKDHQWSLIDPLCRLSVLLKANYQSNEIAQNLCLSNKEKNKLSDFSQASRAYNEQKNIFSLFYLFPRDIFFCVMLLADIKNKTASSYHKIYEEFKDKTCPVFPLSGQDLIENGMKPDKNLGIVLKQTENWWMEEEGKPDHLACLNYALSII